MNGVSDERVTKGMQRQFTLLNEREQSGARRIGWKVGFGAPAAKERLKLDAPLIGFLLDRAVLSDGASVSLAGWTKPVAEPEIAIEMGHDLLEGANAIEVSRAIAAIGPAIELADLEFPPDDVEAILAGNIYQRQVTFGARRKIDLPAGLSGLSGTVTRSGRGVVVPDDLQANTGPILDIVGQVATTLAAFGTGLRKGEVIIAGSVPSPLMLGADDNAVRWDLAPIGSVSLTFKA